MEIRDIETTLVRADTSFDARHYCIVEVLTDEGITGIGEATAPGMERATEMAVHDLGRLAIGEDPRQIEGLWERMYNGYAWNWGAVSMTALSGIEMALWDIVGKYHDVRVCDLLGGPMREEIPVYANGFYDIENDPDDLADSVQSMVEQGYDFVKFDPFYADGERAWPNERQRERARARLDAVRDRVGDDISIGIESHGVLSARAAVELAALVEPYDPAFFEEPVPPENEDAMRRVRQEVDIPLATGERLLTTFDYREFFQHPTPADIVQPDVNNCGGISQLKKIAAMAHSDYVPIAPHNSRGPVATAAAAHACATIPNFLILEYFPESPPWRQDLVVTPERVADGVYHLPEGPGLGIELDRDAMAEHPYDKSETAEARYSHGYEGVWQS
jgi:galactonate dehydratase